LEILCKIGLGKVMNKSKDLNSNPKGKRVLLFTLVLFLAFVGFLTYSNNAADQEIANLRKQRATTAAKTTVSYKGETIEIDYAAVRRGLHRYNICKDAIANHCPPKTTPLTMDTCLFEHQSEVSKPCSDALTEAKLDFERALAAKQAK